MSYFKGKNIAILGGSGTLGQAILELILQNHTDFSKVLIFSRDEIKQLEMMEKYPEDSKVKIEYRLGDVRDSGRVEEVLNGIDLVVHAAAIKHVVMAERNPEECWKTNVEGTRRVVEACKINGVKQAILISTDKATNPLGVYGKSKKKAEKVFLTANSSFSTFKVISLGNIIGARGSVFEAFQRQRETGVIKVTHPEATRFCISKEKAAKLILNLFPEDHNYFVPKMETFSVLELAKQIAPECEIEIVGLRPGDKLHEEMGGTYSNKKWIKIL